MFSTRRLLNVSPLIGFLVAAICGLAIWWTIDSSADAINRYQKRGIITSEAGLNDYLTAFLRSQYADLVLKEGEMINKPVSKSGLHIYCLSSDPERRFGHGDLNASYDAKTDSIFLDTALVRLCAQNRENWQLQNLFFFLFSHELGHRTLHRNTLSVFDGLMHRRTDLQQYREKEADVFAIEQFFARQKRTPDQVSDDIWNLSEYALLTLLTQQRPFSALAASRTHPSILERVDGLYQAAAAHPGISTESRVFLGDLHAQVATLLTNLQNRTVATIELPPNTIAEGALLDNDTLHLISFNGRIFTLSAKVLLDTVHKKTSLRALAATARGVDTVSMNLGPSFVSTANGDLAAVNIDGRVEIFPNQPGKARSQMTLFEADPDHFSRCGERFFAVWCDTSNRVVRIKGRTLASNEISDQTVEFKKLQLRESKDGELTFGNSRVPLEDILVAEGHCVLIGRSDRRARVDAFSFDDGQLRTICDESGAHNLDIHCIPEWQEILIVRRDRQQTSLSAELRDFSGKTVWKCPLPQLPTLELDGDDFQSGLLNYSKFRLAIAVQGSGIYVLNTETKRLEYYDFYSSGATVCQISDDPPFIIHDIPYSRFLLVVKP